LAYHRALFECFKEEMVQRLVQKVPYLRPNIENFGLSLTVSPVCPKKR
jgi:hypothetical protein